MKFGNKMNPGAVALSLAAMLAAPAAAQITIDGTADAGYGAALSTQNTNTQFGNKTGPVDPIVNNSGSEIDQVFATVANGRLYVTIAGNLEANFNKMEVYIDSKSGGFNTINGATVPDKVDGYCCTVGGGVNLPKAGDGALQRQSGLTFDNGFNADYYLTFSRGGENVGPTIGFPDGVSFYAITAHYADLQGNTSQALGMQLAYNGLPNVLRGPLGPDFNSSGSVAGEDFLAWQRGNGHFDGTTTLAAKTDGDSNGDKLVDATDLTNWKGAYGTSPSLGDYAFNPYNGGPSSQSLLGPALPGLSQGQLIDKTYALGAGTSGGALIARELAFVLPVDTINDANNTLNHRDMLNTVGLQMAMNDSNVAGVTGAGPYSTPTTGDPQTVTTGLEFSIPLSALGSPTAGSPIRITAFVNSGGHDYSSNQYSGTGVLRDNLANTFDLGGIDLRDDSLLVPPIAGNQYVTVNVPAADLLAAGVPEPSAIALGGLALGLLGYAKRRS